MATSEKHLIQTYFEPGDKYSGEFLNTTEMLVRLNNVTEGKLTTKLNTNNIGKSLRQLGYEQGTRKIGKYPQKGYWVKQKYTQLGDQINIHNGTQEAFEFESKIF